MHKKLYTILTFFLRYFSIFLIFPKSFFLILKIVVIRRHPGNIVLGEYFKIDITSKY